MREIKFRAWDLTDNKWFYSSSDPLKKLNDDNWTGHGDGELVWQQYTGLKDKNGKEIYEGDIIHSPSWWWGAGEVFLSVGKCGPCEGDNVMSYACRNYKGMSYNIWNGADVVIIGNVYENPELL